MERPRRINAAVDPPAFALLLVRRLVGTYLGRVCSCNYQTRPLADANSLIPWIDRTMRLGDTLFATAALPGRIMIFWAFSIINTRY